jgi:hypothetical protein
MVYSGNDNSLLFILQTVRYVQVLIYVGTESRKCMEKFWEEKTLELLYKIHKIIALGMPFTNFFLTAFHMDKLKFWLITLWEVVTIHLIQNVIVCDGGIYICLHKVTIIG